MLRFDVTTRASALVGVTRFEEFQQRLGIARNILAARLDTLVAAGVLERRLYDEARERYDYVLTDKGRALWPVVMTLRRWGDAWITGAVHEPVTVLHTRCGSHTSATLVCDHCRDVLEPADMRFRPGPGSTDPEFVHPTRRTAPSLRH